MHFNFRKSKLIVFNVVGLTAHKPPFSFYLFTMFLKLQPGTKQQLTTTSLARVNLNYPQPIKGISNERPRG